jgi:hypothetical protein
MRDRRWETEKEAQEWEISRKFKILETRRKERAARDAEIARKRREAEEKDQRIRDNRSDALTYFTELIKVMFVLTALCVH